MFNSDYKLGCDAHKHFSLFAIRNPSGQIVDRVRINHYPGAIHSFLSHFPEDTPVALETVGKPKPPIGFSPRRNPTKNHPIGVPQQAYPLPRPADLEGFVFRRRPACLTWVR